VAKTALSAAEKFRQRLLRQRIPDRMFEVHFCKEMIGIMTAAEEAAKKAKSEATEEAVIIVGGTEYSIYPLKMLRFVALDAGIMMCRALMNFLGIYYHGGAGQLRAYAHPQYATDVSIGDFGLNALSVAEACAALPGRNAAEVEKDLLITLKTADIGVGHLTRTAARDSGSLTPIANTCDLVITLINEYLYKALDADPVTFDGHAARRCIRARTRP
jgi:hypothetical protein